MSKAVMISIQPRWCEKILRGEKTVEVRKTRPKLETPFKCYIYCTKPRFEHEDFFALVGKQGFYGGGKVIGEFVCDQIAQLVPSFREPAEYRIVDDRGWAYPIELMLEEACVTAELLFAYLGGENGVVWNISDLKIYDKPCKLDEFERLYECDECTAQWASECNACHKELKIKRPPQSWRYVQENEGVLG